MFHKPTALIYTHCRVNTIFLHLKRLNSTKEDVKFRILECDTRCLPISETVIQQANVDLSDVEISLSNYKLAYNTTWLRDSCHCMQCTHQFSRQRLFTAKDFRRELFSIRNINLAKSNIEEDCLIVNWVDGHESTYSLNWLRQIHNLYEDNNHSHISLDRNSQQQRHLVPEDDYYAPLPQNKCESRLWTVSQIRACLKPIDFPKLLDGVQTNDDATYINANKISEMSVQRLRSMKSLTDQLVANGIAKIVNVPQEVNQVLRLVRSLAYERPTGYGTIFNVVVEPTEEKNLAYSSLEFDLHSDLTYREISPGVQLLHCIQNSNKGGLSFFSDAFNAAYLLKQSDPFLYEVLLQFPATFIVRDPYRDINFRRRQPVISLDHQGNLKNIYYSPFMLPPVGPRNDVRLFYLAYDKFTRILQDRENKLIEKMNPGDLFIFHNRRVLHGRSSYDAKASRRFLQGCYMDWDEIEGLREKLHANKTSTN